MHPMLAWKNELFILLAWKDELFIFFLIDDFIDR